uniref:Uncharacterized protein n=1 Tax=Anguilla anguilla TaxID=7936 RepID=A0A0E9TWK4_ANGAN
MLVGLKMSFHRPSFLSKQV